MIWYSVICGMEYREPSAISRSDDKTEICSSCGIRQAVEGILPDEDIEELVRKNKEMYSSINGCG